MSGIFKYTPNRTATSTPNRRSGLGTGFGSPGVHQDASMDNSYAMGFRTPSINALTGHGSPVQVRSLRENEEEISSLRKENFNLKLRIYFLEQKAGICTESDNLGLGLTNSSSASGASCDGNYAKQNIDLKVELESLRRDLIDKQQLLCQAAKAIEVLEEDHRKTEEKHREMVADLNNRIEMHLLEIKSLEKMGAELQQLNRELQNTAATRTAQRSVQGGEEGEEEEQVIGFTRASSAREAVGESLLDFLDTVQQHSEMSVQEKLKALDMESIVRQCQEQNEELNRQVEQLQALIDEKTATIGQLEVQLRELRFENAEMREKLDEQPSQVDAEIDRLKKQVFDIRAELADKVCVLDDTETKLKEKTVELAKSCKVVEKLIKTLSEQDREIAKLKRNSNISLPSEHGTSGGNSSLHEVVEIVDQDRKPVSQAEYDALVQRAKLLQQKNDTLIHKLCSGAGDHRNDRNIIIKQLNDELIQAREEAEKAQRWRKECADLCAISTLRLEELAGFLDSLLKNKEFVGTLSIDRRKAMRKAVDRSLDLSRSLNMSISVTGFSGLTANNSLAQLSCLSGFLEPSLRLSESSGHVLAGEDDAEHDKENRAANNGGKVQEGVGGSSVTTTPQTKQMIETLRAENRALRGELFEHQQQQARNKRRESKERKPVPVAIEPISDSEAWSEPDRDVSLARIGLEDNSALLRQKQSPAGAATTGSMILSNSGSGAGAMLELSSTSDNEATTGAGASGTRKSISVLEFKQLQDTVAVLSGELRAKETTVQQIEARLAELDAELQQERTRLASVESEADGNRQASARWEREAQESREKAERASERLRLLENDILQKDTQMEKLRKEREQAAVDLRVAEMKLDAMRAEYDDMQQRHKHELEAALAKQQQHLDELRRSLTDAFQNEMQLKQQSFDTALAQNYISKNIHQEKLRELDELHYRLEDAHNDLATMAQTEQALRAQVTEAERLVASMKKSLDEATLHASKLAVERTKALNEKRQLEADLGRTRNDLEQLKCEKNELNRRLQAAMEQVATVTHDRSTSICGRMRDARNSTSATDEELTAGRRRLENSSPDLGIESDPGRLSNTELTSAGAGKPTSAGSPQQQQQQRPLLKTLELTKSMSNLLLNPTLEVKTEDGAESSKGESETTTVVKHDCAKIEADYAELRRRYKETRRCLTQAYDNIKQANKRKEQLEVDIKQQIHKTRDVLRTVHSNMDPSGSERR
ncbi:AGAP002434-PA-like protein [Anopheles sinensis]|uniref:AGAP002434-PA-like protein n=1 Tax=Anopheles sinensis TaxID=74873 RepID=A0A084VU56_ANOSI|nr:AGAP002434-PA-like protein [Anopheles sinensis]